MNSKFNDKTMNSKYCYDAVPGLMKSRPSKCCLVCVLKDLRFQAEVVEWLMTREISIKKISELEVGEVMAIEMFPFLTENEVKAMIYECKTLMELNPNLPWIHQRYYAPTYLRYAVGHQDGEVVSRVLYHGQQLVIFYDSNTENGKNSLLLDLKGQATALVHRRNDYCELLPTVHDQTVALFPERNLAFSFRPTAEGFQETMYNVPTQTHCLTDWTSSLTNVLQPISGVHAIIIDGVFSDEESHLPVLQDWLNSIVQVFGELENIMLVLTVNVDKGRKIGIKSSSEVVRAVNENLNDKQVDDMIFLTLCD